MAKISPDLEKEMLAKAAEGWTSEAIASWIASDRGVKVSGAAVRLRLSKTRQDRGELLKAVVTDRLAKKVLSDLDVLDIERRRCRKLATRLYNIAMASASNQCVNAEAGELFLKAVDRVEKLASTRLKFAGLEEGKPIETVSDDELRGLAKKAMKLLEGT